MITPVETLNACAASFQVLPHSPRGEHSGGGVNRGRRLAGRGAWS